MPDHPTPGILPLLPFPWPRWIVHRGGGDAAPENTLAGMLLAAFSGAKMVEFDVRLSADGVPFLLHDDTLERTTDGHGPADALPWKALSRLDAGAWFSPRFADEPLPSLADAAQLLNDHGLCANVEIKPGPGREAETGARVAADCARLFAGQPQPPLLSSFSVAALAAARDAAPQLPRALLLAEWHDDWLAQAQALSVCAIDLGWRELTAERVAAIHQAGLWLLSWTVNDADTAQALWAMGVDALCTDALALAGQG